MTSLHTVPLAPLDLSEDDLRTLESLLARLPKEGCTSGISPVCDYCLHVNLEANGTSYMDNACALTRCWTADMAAVLDFVDDLAARSP